MQVKSKDSMLFDTAKRYYNYRLQRFVGVPQREKIVMSDDCDFNGMCPFTKEIYQYNKALGKRISFLVPCGRCMRCRHKSQNSIIYRLVNHMKMYKKSVFVTLTYNDQHYPDSDEVETCRKDITKFLKRFRKSLNDETFSYYMVCERGDLKDRLHFHLLLFWNGPCSYVEMASLIRAKWFAPARRFTTFTEIFSYLEEHNRIPSSEIGFVYIDDTVNNNVASYVSKYVTELGKKLVFRSWSIGLGADILACDDDLVAKMRYLNIIEYMPGEKKYSIPLPLYYKNKLFTQSERDCFFADYLISPEYARKYEFYSDVQKWCSLLDSYYRYEKRCKDAYYLKKIEKYNKARLI